MELKDMIRTLRISGNLTQKDVGKALDVSTVTVQNWEKGTKIPSTKAVISMCRLFGISSDELLGLRMSERNDIQFSKEELKLIETYRMLDPVGKKAVNSVCRIESTRYMREETKKYNIRMIPQYYTPAAAGTSVPVDGEDYEMIPADDAPYNADFAVRIQGNSMSPIIEDGDTVYVSRNTELVNGDVGIFCVDGAMYCKQLFADGDGNVTLVSANPDLSHTNVYIGTESGSSLTVYGKVLTGYRPDLPDYLFEED